MTVDVISQSISTDVWVQAGRTRVPWTSSQARYRLHYAGTHSTVGNMSGCRYVSDCRFRGPEFDLGPVPYFQGY